MKEKVCYVQSVLDKEITIKCNDPQKSKILRSMGGKRRFFSKSEWIFNYSSNEDLANIFMKLRDSGFSFSYDEHGWGPSDLFRHHRKNGLLTGKFTEIYWIGGGKYRKKDE